MPDVQPSFAEFQRLARRGNVLPVYSTIVADLLSPVSAYLRLAPETLPGARPRASAGRAHPYSFLLESVEGGERVGRYTFFGIDPFQVISSRGDRINVVRGPHRSEESGDIFECLRQVGARYRSVALPGLPPFSAGAVGFLAYEAVRRLERLPPRVEMDVDVDDAAFMYFSNLVAFDHVQHRLFLIANVLTEEGAGTLRAKYDAAVRQLARMERLLRRPLELSRHRPPRGPWRVQHNMTRQRYESMVERAKEYIRAGDIFQVVVSQRLEAPVRVPPFEIYRALRAVNPSPYLYFLR
ncbi:MAG TPA: chorismate-binding protein, partial [Terriglobia bacterium]|nr:chorismate-binding protein [Terriglobia bacterium]